VDGINSLYGWEVEHVDHSVVRQFNEDGTENPSTMIRAEEVVRASIYLRSTDVRRFNALIDRSIGERFVKRFGRGIMKDVGGMKLVEYIHCIETTHYRLWVMSSTGQAIVTKPDYELYP
jgi:hypothetical protein